ncbi:MAG TPA: threonine/serine exporter [Erysipelotrichaceae bacterium]|jgi:uncharacterized membrane protein YjjB (DUF3815 family)|nr:threonine/serine exporter [Erysipelotrichaceae bacterium]
MDIIKQTLIATCSVFLIAIVLDAPKKSLPFAAITGGIGWFVYLMVGSDSRVVYSTFIAAGVIAFLAHIFSRGFKTPTTVFLISALYPFVPGTSVYRAVYALIANDFITSKSYALQSILISGSIATAVFMIDSIFIIYGKIKKYHLWDK